MVDEGWDMSHNGRHGVGHAINDRHQCGTCLTMADMEWNIPSVAEMEWDTSHKGRH